jgi:hypothetical protein
LTSARVRDFHAFDATASDFGVDVTLPIPAANALSDDSVFVNVTSWQDAGGQTAPTTSLAWGASALGDTFVDATWAYTAP